MSELQGYTPTEADIERARGFIERRDAVPGGVGTLEDFAAVLAAHDAEVRAEERAKRPDREQFLVAAERRWPSYPTVGFSGPDDRQSAFMAGVDAVLAQLTEAPEAPEEGKS